MENLWKEEGKPSGCGKDFAEQNVGKHKHTFKFRKNNSTKKFSVTCDAPMTILERLQSDFYFKALCKKFQGEKEVIIQRAEMPRASMSPDSPCCLIDEDELLDVMFIKSNETHSRNKKTPAGPSVFHSREDLVTFFIKTRGEENIRKLMRNSFLKNKLDYVCVHGVRGEKVKAALKRDGRFNRVIYNRGALADEEDPEDITRMSDPVDRLNGRQFKVIRFSLQGQSQGSSLEFSHEEHDTVHNGSQEVPGNSHSEQKTGEPSTNQKNKAETPGEKTKTRRNTDIEKIPNSQEILELLRNQFDGLLEKMKEREKLKNKSEVQKFFREEYDKSVQSFSEVKRVRQLMDLSDSVCQIRVEGSARGSGFLLFSRFIITNAHVVKDVHPFRKKTLQYKTTAVFHYEDQQDAGSSFPVKEEVVVLFKGNDEMGNLLDFALLELELNNDEKPPPGLLHYYSAPPSRGGVCIIGHPDGGVKKMDACFLIPKGEEKVAADRHVSENQEYLQVMTQMSVSENWELHSSQINCNSCFFHGSSGSPMFDEFCYLIGVYTGGYVYPGKGGKTRSVLEYALPMFPILVHIYQQCFFDGKEDIVQYLNNQKNLKLVRQTAEELIKRTFNTFSNH